MSSYNVSPLSKFQFGLVTFVIVRPLQFHPLLSPYRRPMFCLEISASLMLFFLLQCWCKISPYYMRYVTWWYKIWDLWMLEHTVNRICWISVLSECQLGKNKYFHSWRGCPSGKDKIDEQLSMKTNEEMNTKQIMSCG